MQENKIALAIGSTLQEYKLESILGIGGFGITYLALDIHLNKKVVIKEFLPNDIAVRKDSDTVVPKSHSDKESFEWGMNRFLLEAQTLAKFNHPNIVKISRFFQENSTAYFVMDYEEGEDLQTYLEKHNKTLSEEEIYNLIMPILDGLREVHAHDFLHRDIKPGNIFIRKNGSPMLIDFGASRFAMGAKSKSLSVVLTEGYAPKEQYSSTSKQGPYTDIYAIGAVIYKMATRKTPIEASARVDATSDDEPDPYKKLEEKNIPYSDSFKKAVDWCMELSAKNRPQSVKELQSALMEKTDEEIKIIEEPTCVKKEEKKDINSEKIGLSHIVKMSIYILLSSLSITILIGIIRTLHINHIANWGILDGLIYFVFSIGLFFSTKKLLNLKNILTLGIYIGIGAFIGDILGDIIYLILKEWHIPHKSFWMIDGIIKWYFISIGVLYAFNKKFNLTLKNCFLFSLFIPISVEIYYVIKYFTNIHINAIFLFLSIGFLLIIKNTLSLNNKVILKTFGIIFAYYIILNLINNLYLEIHSVKQFFHAGDFNLMITLHYFIIGLSILHSIYFYKKMTTKSI